VLSRDLGVGGGQAAVAIGACRVRHG
jgi:hypothetical protein